MRRGSAKSKPGPKPGSKRKRMSPAVRRAFKAYTKIEKLARKLVTLERDLPDRLMWRAGVATYLDDTDVTPGRAIQELAVWGVKHANHHEEAKEAAKAAKREAKLAEREAKRIAKQQAKKLEKTAASPAMQLVDDPAKREEALICTALAVAGWPHEVINQLKFNHDSTNWSTRAGQYEYSHSTPEGLAQLLIDNVKFAPAVVPLEPSPAPPIQ